MSEGFRAAFCTAATSCSVPAAHPHLEAKLHARNWSQRRAHRTRPVAPAQAAFHVFGMELLCRLDLRHTNAFFATFFRLPGFYWRGFLGSTLSSAQLLAFAMLTFAIAPASIQSRLVTHLLTDPAGSYLVRAYLGERTRWMCKQCRGMYAVCGQQLSLCACLQASSPAMHHRDESWRSRLAPQLRQRYRPYITDGIPARSRAELVSRPPSDPYALCGPAC